jgi:uncharacterized protein YdiU (UPF0061 family)
MKSKLGLFESDANDQKLIEELEDNLALTETDMTIFFRNLSKFEKDNFKSGLDSIKDAFYESNNLSDSIVQKWNNWFKLYATRLDKELLTNVERQTQMNLVNPKYVLRNYM